MKLTSELVVHQHLFSLEGLAFINLCLLHVKDAHTEAEFAVFKKECEEFAQSMAKKHCSQMLGVFAPVLMASVYEVYRDALINKRSQNDS